MAGTAPGPYDEILCVETEHGWTRDALDSLDPEEKKLVTAWLAQGRRRFQALRRTQKERIQSGQRFFYLANLKEKKLRSVSAKKLTQSAWKKLQYAPPTAESLLLVCTHGRRDRCCSTRGRKAFATLCKLAEGRPCGDDFEAPTTKGRTGKTGYTQESKSKHESMDKGEKEQISVWQSSHLGGHRFAATALSLPDGMLWGQIDEEGASETLFRYLGGNENIPTSLMRGNIRRAPALQMAEIEFIKEHKAADLEGSIHVFQSAHEITIRSGQKQTTVQIARAKNTLNIRKSCENNGLSQIEKMVATVLPSKNANMNNSSHFTERNTGVDRGSEDGQD